MAPPEGSVTLTLGAVPLTLLAERAACWEDVLFVADVHLDKATFFQRQGFPVPQGSDQDDLLRLDALLTRQGARELVVLGTFFIAPPSPGARWIARCTGGSERSGSRAGPSGCCTATTTGPGPAGRPPTPLPGRPGPGAAAPWLACMTPKRPRTFRRPSPGSQATCIRAIA